MNKFNKLLAVAVAMAFTQYGCGGGGGGGGGGDVTSPVVEAQGLYIGTTSKNQTVFTWILDDGSLYALYASSDSSELDGVLAGNMKASGEALSSSDVIDYGLTNSETHKATISATYAPKGWLNGALAYPDVGGASVNFTTTYDTDYEKKPTLAAIAGTYEGTTKGLNTRSTAAVAIDTNGVMAFNSGTCTARGTVVPRAAGNAYSVTLNFDASRSCAYANQTLSGMTSSYDDSVIIFARAADATYPLLFWGEKRQ